jgi:sugar phosphate isomerase/epimerase
MSISPIKTSFGPRLFSGDMNKGLETANELGYDAVELCLSDPGKIHQEWLLNRLKELHLNVTAISTGETYYIDGYSLYEKNKDIRRKAIERIKSHIDLAVRLNCMVVIGGIRGKISEAGIEKIRQDNNGKAAVRECLEYAEIGKIVLLLEPINRYETNLFNNVEDGIRIIDEFGSNYFKLLLDTFHMNIEEKSIEHSIMMAADYLGYIHFADSNRLAPGWGHTDFKNIIISLMQMKYRGAIGIEILPKPDDYSAARQAINYVKTISGQL